MRGTLLISAAVGGLLCLGACGGDSVTPADPAPEPTVRPQVSSTEDFSRDNDASQRAVEAANEFASGLDEDPSFGGLAIVPSGLRVDVAGPPSAVVSEAVARMGERVPVTTRSVPNSMRDLMALTDQINRDFDAWRKKGVRMSSWGPESESNTVRVTLNEYRPAAAEQLIAAYGSDRLSVSKRSETNRPM